MKIYTRNILLFAALAGAALSTAHAETWSFGVMADTQFTGYTIGGTNGVATDIIDAVNQQFVSRGVDFVVQVGDLSESGGASQLQTRLDHNQLLTDNGIEFYGLRGNHESDTTSQTFFQNNYLPTTSADASVELAGFDSTSYAVTHKGTKIVLLDIGTAGNTTALDSATSWMGSVLGESDHTQAFVFQHKNFLGQNHKDNEFGSGNDSNPTQQNNFLSTLATNNVKWDFSGHDHMNHRSIVTSPDGQSKVQEIICQSDSTKFYTASSGFSSREQSISDQQLKIGYYVVTVSGPRVSCEYWTTNKDTPDSNQNGTITANPVWTLQDTFGYSINGKEFLIARGGSYTGVADNTDLAIAQGGQGYLGTHMAISYGTNTVTATAEGGRACIDDLNTGWSPKADGNISDTLSLWGMNNALGSEETDVFTLTLSFDPSQLSIGSIPMLGTLCNGQWVNAVAENFGGTAFFAGDRAFDPLSDGLGTYGYNSATGEAWAVVNHNSDFAVQAVPEPATAGLLAFGFGGMLMARRGRRS